jgi:hypothetical protein
MVERKRLKCGRSRSEEKKWEDDGGRTCWPLWPRKSKARNVLMGPVKWETTTVGPLQAYCFALQGGRLSVSTNNTVGQERTRRAQSAIKGIKKSTTFLKIWWPSVSGIPVSALPTAIQQVHVKTSIYGPPTAFGQRQIGCGNRRL